MSVPHQAGNRDARRPSPAGPGCPDAIAPECRSGSLIRGGLAVCLLALLVWAPLPGASAAIVEVYPAIGLPEFSYDKLALSLTVGGKHVPIREFMPYGSSEEYLKLRSALRQHQPDAVPSAAPEETEEGADEKKAEGSYRTYQDRCYLYAHCGISGSPVQVEIDAKEAVSAVAIRPQAFGIKPTVAGSIIRFVLDQPRYLAIQINDHMDLFLLADPIETERPVPGGADRKSGKRVIDVSAPPYGADGKPGTAATEGLRRALDEAGRGPNGGIVLVPPGIYATGRLQVPSKVWLYLAPGAILVADSDRRQWHNQAAPDEMISFKGSTGAKIYGRGVVYCRSTLNGLKWAKLRTEDPEANGKFRGLRLSPFDIDDAQDLAIEGITAHDSSAWTVYIKGKRNITVTNVKVLNSKLKTGTNDGINVGGGSDVTIRHCFVSTLDDAVCLKGIMGAIANVHIEDVVADSARSCLKFGMQGMTPISGISVKDFHGIRGEKGLDVSHDVGQEDYRDLRISGSSFDRTRTPLRIAVRDNSKNWGGRGRGVASVVGIAIADTAFCEGSMSIAGYDPDNVVRGIALENVRIGSQRITAADIGVDGKVRVLPYVYDLTVDKTRIALPQWPQPKAVKDPPRSKSRAGKAWEETHPPDAGKTGR